MLIKHSFLNPFNNNSLQKPNNNSVFRYLIMHLKTLKKQQQQHDTNNRNNQAERNWAEIFFLCLGSCAPLQLSWRLLLLRKWLNIAATNSDYSADTDSGSDSDSDIVDFPSPRESRFKTEKPDGVQVDTSEALPRIRRRKSETFRSQYINSKEIRVCSATWNVGAIIPPDDLDLDGWLDLDEPADIYVIGLQEIIPLNAGNILGAEDNRPVSKWENIIRETLNQVPPSNKFKSYSDPPSPSRFKPAEDAPNIEEEIVLESDSDVEDGIYPVNEEPNEFDEIKDEILKGKYSIPDDTPEQELLRQFSSPKRLDRLSCLMTDDPDENVEDEDTLPQQYTRKLTKTLSGTERIGLSWPEPALHLLPQHVIEGPNSFKGSKSFKASKSFKTYNSFKSNNTPENRMVSTLESLAEIDLESLINRKRRPPYVRIVSKQMVGLFVTIWVRRSLRRHIQNLNVSTVGVGVMGYIGNKGSISVSMSIHQTLFCFICTHLSAGEKEADAIKRNADVHEIHRRTRFSSLSAVGLPRNIYDHERVIWLGDLNYRINLSYGKTTDLVSKKDWTKLLEHDQLIKEFKKGRAFDGWSEGRLTFAPTYKYEINSDSYVGMDPTKPGRRTPAWCDRIISFGTGMKLISYRRSELKLSDHRPVTATYIIDVEVFSPRKLQRALTFTDAEIEEHDIVTDMGLGNGISRLRSGEDVSYRER